MTMMMKSWIMISYDISTH